MTGDEPTIKDLTYAEKSPDEKLDLYLPAKGSVPVDSDTLITASQAQRRQDALLKAGAKSTLTILPGAGHEDPAFMETQMTPTFEFLDSTLGR